MSTSTWKCWTALGLKEMGAVPGGTPSTFWLPTKFKILLPI